MGKCLHGKKNRKILPEKEERRKKGPKKIHSEALKPDRGKPQTQHSNEGKGFCLIPGIAMGKRGR